MSVGVVDAGVVLTRLDPLRRSHDTAVNLFAASARRAATLSISVVNLAEALEHSEAYAAATGVDLVAVLGGFGISIVLPDVDIARRVAGLRFLHGASLADRFALATAQALRARLHTTDRVLAGFSRRCRVPITLY